MRASTALALTALQVLTSDKYRNDLHEAWQKDMKAIDAEHAMDRLKSTLSEKGVPIPSEKKEEQEANGNGHSCGCSR